MLETLVNLVADVWRGYSNFDDNLRSLERKLQILRCRKFDMEGEVAHAEESCKKKRKREVENWFEAVADLENEFRVWKQGITEGGILRKAFSGDSVEKMRRRVEELIQGSHHFDKLCQEDFESRGERRVTTKLFGEIFNQGLESILEWLGSENISSIGIYGMGGAGKTTLAKHIHNRLLEESGFKVYWITAAREFSVKKLQHDIAKRLKLDLSYEDDEDSRAAMLSRALVQPSVLILDNLWEEFWLEKIGISPGASKCKLVVTTRSRQVCQEMNCQKIFKVETLRTNESWDLFKNTLNLEMELPADVEGVAKSVSERCAGLPLRIIRVAGGMRGISDIREWRTALGQLNAHSVGHDKIKKENSQILSTVNVTTQLFLNVEAENSVLRAQMMELTQRLQSLNEILNYMNTSNDVLDTLELQPNSEIFMNNPWNLIYCNQPIMASADLFLY